MGASRKRLFSGREEEETWEGVQRDSGSSKQSSPGSMPCSAKLEDLVS